MIPEDAKILFVVPAENQQARQFASSLKHAMPHRNIAITDAGITGLLFELRKHDLVHFFLPAAGRSAPWLRKIGAKAKTVHTLLSQPSSAAQYKDALIGDAIVVFSESARAAIEQNAPGKRVTVAPPCIHLPDATTLSPASTVRQKAGVAERMLVITLNEMTDRNEFDSLLYIAREFNRREVFRFLIPQYKTTKNTLLWRDRLRNTIETEKLTSATLMQEPADFHSLLDAADIALYFDRNDNNDFEFPLTVIEALLRGKPVICFDKPPINEYLRNFNENWIARNTEDFVREARDLQKREASLEEISTELARYARSHFEPASVAARYHELYNRLLIKQPAAK
jgi:hypothetical protein